MQPKMQDGDLVEFTQALGLLVRRVRAAAAAQELSLSESAVLARLEKEGPATGADLARAESMRPQSMGVTIAALEERGFVERTPHPTDRRQMHVGITAKGLATRKHVKDAKHNWLAQAVAKLDEEDRAILLAAGRIMRSIAEGEPR